MSTQQDDEMFHLRERAETAEAELVRLREALAAAADLIRSALDGGGGFDPWLRAEQEDDRRERD